MEKKDFYKGQTVWVYLVGNAALRCPSQEKRVQEWEVLSIGRKYITCCPKGFPEICEAKFSIENNFQEKYDGCINHVLYLSKEDLIRDIRIKESEVLIRKFFRRTDWILSYEDTEKIREIIENHEKEKKHEG